MHISELTTKGKTLYTLVLTPLLPRVFKLGLCTLLQRHHKMMQLLWLFNVAFSPSGRLPLVSPIRRAPIATRAASWNVSSTPLAIFAEHSVESRGGGSAGFATIHSAAYVTHRDTWTLVSFLRRSSPARVMKGMSSALNVMGSDSASSPARTRPVLPQYAPASLLSAGPRANRI